MMLRELAASAIVEGRDTPAFDLLPHHASARM